MAVAPTVAISTDLLAENLCEFARFNSPAASLLFMSKVPSGGVSASGLLPGVYKLRYHAAQGCHNFRTRRKSRLCAMQQKLPLRHEREELTAAQKSRPRHRTVACPWVHARHGNHSRLPRCTARLSPDRSWRVSTPPAQNDASRVFRRFWHQKR